MSTIVFDECFRSTLKIQLYVKISSVLSFIGLGQCFPTFFGSRHPYLVMKIFGSTLSLFHRFKDQVILKIGGTPGTFSRHPGWEPLA